MVRRLVLGCGTVGYLVTTSLEASGELFVVDPDGNRVETLREGNVAARRGDPTDPAALADLDRPETVFVASDDPETNRAAAGAAREAFPDACLVVYAGSEPDPDDRDAMAELADRFVDGGASVASRLLGGIHHEAGERLGRLNAVLRGIDGRLGVFAHDNPDPDAIASAMALRELAAAVGLPADACYFGDISRQENRAFVNLLDIDLVRLDDGFDPEEYGGIALVDHSRPGVNDQLPPDAPVDIVIDHHRPREPIDADFVDLRSDVGATSTLLAGYLRQSGIEVSESVATALLYGIRVDTWDFEREITASDFEAAAFLTPHADADLLERVEGPTVTADTFDTIARAISERRRAGPVLVSGVGRINDRDALAQAADQLLDMEGISATMVYGLVDGTVYASARTRGADLDIGEVMRQAFDQIGSAGGHADMAGAQIPLGILGSVEEGEGSLDAMVSEMITDRFFEVIDFPAVARPPEFDFGPIAPEE